MNYLLKIISSLVLALALFFIVIFPTLPLYAKDINLSPEILELTNEFSNGFCIEILNGATPENAGQIASKKLIKGLIFSPIIKEIMTVPKEYIATSLSQEIFVNCGEELGVTEAELNDYLITLANNPSGKTNRDPLKQLGIGSM